MCSFMHRVVQPLSWITEQSQETEVVAIGGDVLWGDGGDAVTGSGTISTNEVFLQGTTR